MGKSTIDLDRDITINGHVFAAGKGVSTIVQEADPDDDNGGTMDVDYGEAVRDVLKANREAIAFAGKHHGQVKDSDTNATTSNIVSGQSSNSGNSGNSSSGAPSGRDGNS